MTAESGTDPGADDGTVSEDAVDRQTRSSSRIDDGPPAGDLDPVTLSVVRGRFDQLVNEMDAALVRSAFSPIITEALDMGNGLYRPDGRTIAQGDHSLPVFIGNMAFTVESVAEAFAGDVDPGDVFITNDPYLGGTHLNDVKLVRPYFDDGELIAYLANTGHWIDIGSAVPGTFNGETRSIHEEGVRIPPLKLYREGDRNEDVLELVFSNLRKREDVEGDFKAQLNALSVARERLDELLAEYGRETIQRAIDELEARSERQMRTRIADIPDGTYAYTDYMDNDGAIDEPLPVAVEITVEDTAVTFDFAGSGRPAVGPLNNPRSSTVSMCHVAFKHIFPDIPVNAGCFAPIRVEVPDETFLNAKHPRATVGYLETSQRVLDAVLGAMAKAIPEKVPAQAFSTSTVTSIGGETDAGEYVMAYAVAGGYGGTPNGDGLNHCTPPFARARMPTVEVMEDSYPIRFGEKRLREDSGGPGRHRGGLGTVYDFTLLADEASASVIGDRSVYTPNGVAGGKNALGMRVVYVRDGEEYVPPLRTKAQDIPLSAGDRVHLESPGGGGYGDPLDRDLDRIERDLRLGYVTPDHAAEHYGVVVETDGNEDDAPRLDREASRRHRESDE